MPLRRLIAAASILPAVAFIIASKHTRSHLQHSPKLCASQKRGRMTAEADAHLGQSITAQINCLREEHAMITGIDVIGVMSATQHCWPLMALSARSRNVQFNSICSACGSVQSVIGCIAGVRVCASARSRYIYSKIDFVIRFCACDRINSECARACVCARWQRRSAVGLF